VALPGLQNALAQASAALHQRQTALPRPTVGAGVVPVSSTASASSQPSSYQPSDYSTQIAPSATPSSVINVTASTPDLSQPAYIPAPAPSSGGIPTIYLVAGGAALLLFAILFSRRD